MIYFLCNGLAIPCCTLVQGLASPFICIGIECSRSQILMIQEAFFLAVFGTTIFHYIYHITDIV